MKKQLFLSTSFVLPFLFLLLFFFPFGGWGAFAQTSYTWDGSSSSAWTTAANWTPSGVPSSIDHVTITSAGNGPVLAADATVTNFTITSGTLDLGGHELTSSGNVSMTGGQVNNGALTQNSTGSTTITGVIVNCELGVEASNISINTSRFIQETHITKRDGSSNTFSGNVWEGNTNISIFGSGAILTIGYSQPDTFLLNTVLENEGRGFVLGASAGSGALVLAGTETQELVITGSRTIAAQRVTVNKPSGKVNLTGTLSIYKLLTLTKGIVNATDGLVYMYNGSSVSGTSNLSYIDGPVEKRGNQAFTFPVGKNGVYRPISITAPSSTSHRFKAEYFNENSDELYVHSSKDGSIAQLSRNDYWNLERTSGTSNVNVTLSWDTLSTSCPFSDAADLVVTSWDGSTWKDRGNGGTTGSLEAGTVISSTASTTYGPFTLGTDDSFDCQIDKLECLPYVHEPKYEAVDTILLNLFLHDNQGNRYHASEVMPRAGGPAPVTCEAGLFTLYFDDATNSTGIGFDHSNGTLAQERRDLVCRVFEDVSELFNHPGPDGRVRIQIRESINNPSSAGAAAIPLTYISPSLTEGILYNNAYQTITTGIDCYTNTPAQGLDLYHGAMFVNFYHPYYLLNGTTTITTENDLYTILLHEVMHILGVASAVSSSGVSTYSNGEFYNAWDLRLAENGDDLINYSGGYSVSYNGAANLTVGCGTPIDFTGANVSNEDIHSPATWAQGSSLSHYSCITGSCPNNSTNDFVVKYCSSPGADFVIRHPNQVEYEGLCDLGYQLTTNYGVVSTSTRYTGYSACASTPCMTYGISDQYAMAFGDPDITISDAQDNDISSGTVNVSNVQVLFGGTTGSNLSVSGNNITYTPSTGFSGIAILSYIPECSGNEGNITYIYIGVPPEALPCTPVACDENIVCNGDLEVVTYDEITAITNFRVTNGNSPDLIINGQNANNGNSASGIGCTNLAFPSPIGGTTYVALAGFNVNREGITLELSNPMSNGDQFNLSFSAHGKSLSCLPVLDVFLSENRPCPVPGAWNTCGNFNPTTSLITPTGINITTASWQTYSPPTYTVSSTNPVRYVTIVAQGPQSYCYLDNISIIPVSQAEVTVASVVSNSTPCPDAEFTITYTVTNLGGSATGNISFEAVVPYGFSIVPGGGFNASGQTNTVNIGAGLNEVFTLTLTGVSGLVGVPSDISFVPVGGACIDVSAITDVITITEENLSIEKTVTNGSTFSGSQTVEYEIEVCNTATSGSSITDIDVFDELDAAFDLTTLSTSDFSVAGNVLTSTISTLAPLACATLEYEIDLVDGIGFCDQSTLTNCAEITDATGNCGLPFDCVDITVTGPAPDETLNNISVTASVGTGTVSGEMWSITGNFVVDANLTLNDCEIAMGANAAIIVENGAVLQIENETHIYACDEMWDGIEVENGGDIRIIGSSIIEDAGTAVLLREGAYYKITDAIFNRNYFHIGHFFIYGSYPINTSGGTISGCKFRCQTTASLFSGPAVYENLHAPFSSGISQIGIYSVVVEGLVASNCEFSNAVYGVATSGLEDINLHDNTFEDITDIGIYITEGDFVGGDVDIVGNTINKTPYGIFCYDNPQAELKIEDNLIDYQTMALPVVDMIGILVSEITPGTFSEPNKVSIHDNEIIKAPGGIQTTNLFGNFTDLYIGENDIKVYQPSYSGTSHSGIVMENNTLALIVSNVITQNNGTTNWWEKGIRCNGGVANQFICNDVQHIGTAFTFFNDQRPWTTFAMNKMGYNSRGLLLNQAIIGQQGSAGSPNDNEWNGTGWNSSNPNTQTNGSGTDGTLSKFYVRNPPPPTSNIYYPEFNENTGTAIAPVDVDGSSGTWTNGCLYTAPSFKTGSEENPRTASAMAVLEQTEDADSDRKRGLRWAGKYGLYQALLADEELRYANNELMTYFEEKDGSTMGKLHRALNGWQGTRSGQGLLTNQAFSELQSIQTEERPERTLKEILGILYTNAAALREMSSADETRLRQIAQLCPIDDGFGVYIARAALLKIDTLPRFYTSECEQSPAPTIGEEWKTERASSSDHNDFRIYPNPNNGQMTLEYTLEEGEKGEVNFYNAIGQHVLTQALKEGVNVMSVELTDVSSGLYSVVGVVNGEIPLSEKVSILRE